MSKNAQKKPFSGFFPIFFIILSDYSIFHHDKMYWGVREEFFSRHTLKNGPGPGQGPSEKLDPGPLKKADSMPNSLNQPKLIFVKFESADVKYDNMFLKS